MTPGFDDLLQKKYQILQQQADSGTTTANAKAQEVGQQQALQQQNNDAAMFLTTRPKPRWANRRAFPEVRLNQRA